MGYALRFISGKYQGGEFPLPLDGEIVIGRSSELDMVLVEDMVSRRHAKIIAQSGDLFLEDLGSTNGSFVNGEKVEKAKLEESDRILIGTSIIKVIETLGASEVDLAAKVAEAKEQFNDIDRQPKTEARKTMSGSIAEVPLPDLLQLFSSSKKSGVLIVRNAQGEGTIHLDQGQVTYCVLRGDEAIAPDKAFFQVMTWSDGTFDMEAGDAQTFENPIQMSTQGLLMEAFAHIDEMQKQATMSPNPDATVSLAQPLYPALRDLSPDELDLLQLCINSETIKDLLEASALEGEEAAKMLKHLEDQGYVSIG